MNEEDARRTIYEAFERAHISPAPGFETRMQVALQAAGLEQSVHRQPARLRGGLAMLIALVAAVALVATLLGPRMLTHFQQPVGTFSPSPSPSQVATSPSPDPNACRLPVIVDHEKGAVVKITAGFIDVASGQFLADPNITFAGLPSESSDRQPQVSSDTVYDSVVKRWLPSHFISPDQLSYFYRTTEPGPAGAPYPAGMQIHIYDLVQYSDRIIWTIGGAAILQARWRADGIYALTRVFAGAAPMKAWRIDPNTGKATEIALATFLSPYQHVFSGPGSADVIGTDPDRAIYITPRPAFPGTRYTAYVIIDGKRTNIYSGIKGDRMDFDPVDVWYDGPRLWFANYDSKYLWSWTAATGLIRHSVQIPGIHAPLSPDFTSYSVAGPCM